MSFVESRVVYCVVYVMAAISVSLFGPVSRAVIGDACNGPARLRCFMWRYTASNLGWAIGPVIGILIDFSVDCGFLSAGGIYSALVMTLMAIDFPHPVKSLTDHSAIALPPLETIRRALADKRVSLLVCAGTVTLAVYSHWSATLGSYLTTVSADGAKAFSILVSINGFAVLLCTSPARRLIAMTGGMRGSIIGSILLCLSQVGFSVFVTLPGLAASMAVLSIGEVMIVCAEFVLIDSISSAANRGAYFGAHAMTNAGSFLGPALGGIVLASVPGNAIFLVFAGLSIAGAALYAIGAPAPQTTNCDEG